MAKIGSGLQETRLKKGLTLDRIADDTNISVRFLAKIENDDFSGFPGEPYVVGFIRNYSDYLGLDADTVLAAYRAKEPSVPSPEPELQEASGEGQAPKPAPDMSPPTPLETASDKPKKKEKAKRVGNLLPMKLFSGKLPGPGLLVAGIAGAVIVLLVALWIIFGAKGSGTPDPASGQRSEYRVESGPFDKRIYPGDSLLVPLGSDVYKIRLTAIDESVRLETPFGPFAVSLGGTAVIDPDGDGEPDISLIVSDFQKNKPKSGALLRVEYSPSKSETNQAGEIMVSGGPAQAPGQAALPRLGEKSDILVTKSTRGPYPFVLQATFRGNCLFRYETDRKDWVEKYYSKGETVTINVNSSVTVWASNAQAAKLTFQASGGRSVDIELGAPGEISVKRFSWNNASGTWALVASELD
jgi:cytoskeletal protein RodZ